MTTGGSQRGRKWRAATVVMAAAAVVAGGVVGGGVVRAAESDPTYPARSFTDWTANPAKDARDADLGRYTFEAGVAGAAGRAADRYPDHYDPARFADPDHGFETLAGEGQAATDGLFHVRPHVPYDHLGEAGYPALTPDWDHDGTFGNPGDFDADTDETPGTAEFLYACAGTDGTFSHENAAGACADANDPASGPFKVGVAKELKIVDSRGLQLDATLWIPGEAIDGDQSNVAAGSLVFQGPERPGVVFSTGVASRQEYYSWIAIRLVRDGYVVLTYDPAGQSESEGTGNDLFNPAPDFPACPIGGACRDIQDVARWFVDDTIEPAVNLGRSNDPLDPATYQEEQGNARSGNLRSPYVSRRSPAYVDAVEPGENVHNPALPVLDTSRISLAGNSMGAISTLSYLNHVGTTGTGYDGRPLPPVVAAVVLSGAVPTKAVVPIQFQTSDYDGSPTLVGPSVGGVGLGFGDEGIGYGPIKQLYNELRNDTSDTSHASPLELVVLEGGTHTDHAAVPYVPRTLWSISLAGDYAADWLNCHVGGDTGACGSAIAPRDHLSRAFASEQVPQGERGPLSSRCITVPDRASLNQSPDALARSLAGSPPKDCQTG